MFRNFKKDIPEMDFLKIFEVMDTNYSPNQQKRIEDLLPKSAKNTGKPIDKSQCKIRNYAIIQQPGNIFYTIDISLK